MQAERGRRQNLLGAMFGRCKEQVESAMRRWPAVLIFNALLTPGVQAREASDEAERRLRVAAPASCELSVDQRMDERSACWHLSCPGQERRILGSDLSAMHQIADVQFSPDQTSLFVLSVGEGHPILEVLPWMPLRDFGKYQPSCSVNPYPGTLSALAWQGDSLLIASDVDLRLQANDARVESMDKAPFEFLLDRTHCSLRDVAGAGAANKR